MSALETSLCATYGDTPSSSCQPPSFDLLRFGYTPSADELGELRQDITSLDASLAVIDAADTDTSNYARLQRHRAQLAECKARKQALAAPILRLPPELLVLIIHAALPPTWTTAAAGATRFPLLETCFRIRRTALAMPELWSTIVMKGFNGKKAIDRFYVVAQSYMDRIKPHPVDIIAKCALFDSQYNRWVIAHMDRIRSIDWYLKVDAIYGSHISAPLLESATLSAYNTQQYSPFRILTFSHAPRLTKLRMNAAAPSCFDIPGAQLESLTIKNMALSLYDLRILQLCTSLRTLKVCILPIYYVPQHGVTPIHIPGMTFPSLRVLRLSRYGHRLAAFIDAPNLVEITVAARASFMRIDLGHYSLLRSSVRSLLTRDLYFLRTLSLKGFLCSHRDGELEDLVSILHLVPQLERLRLAYEIFAMCDLPLLRRLVAPHSGLHPLLPNLAHLALEYDDIAPDFEFGDVLKELVLSRWGADGAEPRECMSVRSRNCRGDEYCECLGLHNWIAGVKGKGIFVNSKRCKSPLL